MQATLSSDGFLVVRKILGPIEVDKLRKELGALKVAPGHRHLAAKLDSVRALASSNAVVGLLKKAVGATPFLVRSIFFDKTPEANWLVPWHQDLTIAVNERVDVPGYGPWSMKDGVPHVQPLMVILESMVTIRFHLDYCDAANGALKVIVGSHRRGRLNSKQIAAVRREGVEFTCAVESGDVLLMRPLLLHASAPASVAVHRRVIHLEYATQPLPSGLEWHERGNRASAHSLR
jgi:ectoine hydroxylase-related dioxygenase (phytanoyl-CoA dioxygenase family)